MLTKTLATCRCFPHKLVLSAKMASKRASPFDLKSPETKKGCTEGTASSSGKHRQSGFDSKWSKDFPFVVYSEGEGMFCSLCRKWKRHLPNRSNVWISTPCTVLRRDSILDHIRSKSHNVAAASEQEAMQVKLKGGIAQAFEEVRTTKKNALVGALKCMYWLAKHEVASTYD